MRKIFFSFTLLSLIFATQLQASEQTLSQFIRSNAVHYWSYVKNSLGPNKLENYLKYDGIVTGDPHPGNFSVALVKTAAGRRDMQFVNIDLDDAGRGPLVLDFVRLVIAIESIGKPIKKRDLEEAYVNGLNKRRMAPPEDVRKLLAMSVSDYEKLVDKYVDDKTTQQGFKFKPGKIEPYTNTKISRATISQLFPHDRVVDLALRPGERGGSASALRIWVLVEDRSKRRRIIELKQYQSPGIASYQRQPPIEQWIAEVNAAIRPGLDPSTYDLIQVPGAGPFWIREKKAPLIDIPYSSDDEKKVTFLRELSLYDANFLGLIHGRQSQGVDYRNAIQADRETFHQATEELVKTYLKLAKEAMEKAQ